MTDYRFVISAFGDEIAQDLAEQLRVLADLNVKHLELRSAWGVNIADFTAEHTAQARALLDNHGFRVSALGSPVGKTPISAPLDAELERAKRLFETAHALDTQHMRIFAFYPPEGTPHADFDGYVDTATERLAALTELAAAAGVTLLLENDEGLTGDTPDRCHRILAAVNSPHLRLAWDAANFVNANVTAPMDSWPALQPFVGTIHMKDLRHDKSRRAAGEGDAQIAELVAALVQMSYRGYIAIEPHPYLVDGRGELHGETGMRYAVEAFRRMLAEQKFMESETIL